MTKHLSSSCRSDNGGASFLPEVVSAIKQMVEERYWQLEGIPRVHIPLEPTLAEGQPHALPGVAIGTEVPVATPDGAPALEVCILYGLLHVK